MYRRDQPLEREDAKMSVMAKDKGRMHWHFRQPELALFWFAKGAERLNATMEGHQVSCLFPGKSRFAVIPAETEIQGEWDVGPVLDYTVVFLNPILMSERLRQAITRRSTRAPK
jgi:AraC family transcriptional regulator